MAKKDIKAVVRLQVTAGQATPAPPVGTALGPHGVVIMDFCKDYNARTQDKRGQVIPAEITIYEDRSFTFITKTPPTSYLIRTALGLQKASQQPGRDSVCVMTDAQLTEIATVKLPDLNTDDLSAAKAQIEGTARSMGVTIA